MNPTDPPRKRRRFLRFAFLAFALVLILVGFAPWIIANTALKEWVIAKAAADLDGKATAGGVSLSWFGPVELRDVVLTDPNGKPALTVPRVVTSKTLPQLLMDSRDPGTITLHNPTLAVVTEGNTTNVERAIAKYLQDDGSPSKPERFALKVIVEKGTIVLSESKTPGEYTLHNFDLALTMPKSRTEPIQLVVEVESRTASTGTLKLDAKFVPEKSLAVDAKAFDLSQLGPLVQRFAVGTVAKGILDSKLVYRWGEKEAGLDGTANVQSLALAGPWLGKDTLALNSLVVESKLAQNAGILKAEKLVVTCDVGSANFQGDFDPAAGADAMLSRAGIALDAEIDLAKLAAKLPGLLRIKEGVEIQQGTIAAKVRSHPGEHGPAWAGTVVTTHLVGTNAGKRIEWQQPLAAAFSLHFQPNGNPFFDKLIVKSDFFGVNGQGEWDRFAVAAELKLDALSVRLGDFVDLGYRLDGKAYLELSNLMDAATGIHQLKGKAQFLEFSMLDSAGVGLREKQLDVTLNATGKKEAKSYRIETVTAAITSGDDRFEMNLREPITNLRSLGSGALGLTLTGELARWQARLGPLLGIPSTLQLGGFSKIDGTLKFANGGIAFDADVKIDNFRYGPAAKPTWSEKSVALQVKGSYGADALQFSSAKLSRDGFTAEGKGKIDQLSTALALDVDGTLTYDLSKIEPQLKAYLGKSGQATGTGTKPFRLAGNLSDGGKNLAVNVGGDLPGSTKKNQLAGNAALEWTSLKAYGFDVGQAELKAKINDGFVKMSPVEATFGGGKVKLEPTLQLNPGSYDLTFAQGQVVQKAKLTPAACAEALGYALPLLANVAEANGTISFDLAENRIPLSDPTLGTVVGVLTIHDAEVSPNDLISQIAALFTAKPLKLKLAQDERVPIRFEKGRVHHQNLSVTIDGVIVRTSGSVGVTDSSLDLIVEVPLNAKIAGAFVPASNPRVRDALAKQTVRVAVKGTMGKPMLDPNAFRNVVGKLVQDAMKDAATGAVEDLFKKGLDGFLPKK